METIKIEKNVPYSEEKRTHSGRKSKYPFDKMKPGDSFKAAKTSIINLMSAANNWKNRRHVDVAKFKAKVVDGRGKVVRLWRLQ